MNASGGVGDGKRTDTQYYSFDWNWWHCASKTEKRVSDLIELMDCPRGKNSRGRQTEFKDVLRGLRQ